MYLLKGYSFVFKSIDFDCYQLKTKMNFLITMYHVNTSVRIIGTRRARVVADL